MSAASKRCAIASSTMKRLAAMQLWPLFTVRPATAPAAVRSRSASASTTNGSDPPSSSTVFLSARPAACATATPAASLPVSETAAIAGSAIRRETTADGTSSAVNVRLRRARGAHHVLDRQRAVPAPFRGVLQHHRVAREQGPAPRSGTHCQNGKVQGMTASTTPSGS
jgi:hypothetical protein